MSERESPLPAYHFAVEVDGIVGAFSSVSGLKVEQTVVEVEEGGVNDSTHKLMGPVKWPNLVLKKGLIPGDHSLNKLKMRVTDHGEPARFSGTITLIGPKGREAKWYFSGAWVVKWEGPELDASKNEISVESVEIAHTGLVMS